MTINLQFSPEFEGIIRREVADPGAAARELLAVMLYRQGKVTHAQLADALGLDRFEAEEVLARHQVSEGLLTMEDVDGDLRTLDRMLGHSRG